MADWDPTAGFMGDIEDTAETLTYILGDERTRYGEKEYDLLVRSYETAREAHRGQFRASGDPYLIHAIETARILSDWRLDPATVCAAVLHDTIEDTGITIDKLAEDFPTPIPELVDGVTNISKIKTSSSQERQIESLRKLILAMSNDLRVTLIKLGDRLHNMRTLEHLKKEQQQRIARATIDIYAPLAHRLGMTRVRSELEDLCMRYLWPDEYRTIANLISRKRQTREKLVKRSIDNLRKRLARPDRHVQVEGRSKHFYGIFHKMRSQGLEFDELYDLIALRVICSTVEECYAILGRVHQLFSPMPGRFKDYIAMPKENLYQSLHTTVIGLRGQITEIQIRTKEMHRIAEYGVASHWKYKEGAGQTSLDPKLLWLRRLTEWLTDVRDPSEFMSALRHEAFSDTILVFTPQGDVIELPAGATPLDFAFVIHTDVGTHCDGVKVNHRVVSLKTELTNGDVVEVITRKAARPSVGWLDVVKTSRARSKIRHYLRTENFDENVQRGREALQRALRSQNVVVPWNEVAKKITENLRSLRGHSIEELLSEIGFGAVKSQAVAHRLYPPKEKPAAAKADKPRPQQRRSRGGVVIEGIDDSVVNFAKCCNPLPGDDIVGYITVGRGVTIHKGNCRNLSKSIASSPRNSHRLLRAEWDKNNLPVRQTEVRLVMADRKGLLGDISTLLTGQDLFILSCESRSRDGQAVMRFSLEVKGRAQLRKALASLRSQPGVVSLSPSH